MSFFLTFFFPTTCVFLFFIITHHRTTQPVHTPPPIFLEKIFSASKQLERLNSCPKPTSQPLQISPATHPHMEKIATPWRKLKHAQTGTTRRFPRTRSSARVPCLPGQPYHTVLYRTITCYTACYTAPYQTIPSHIIPYSCPCLVSYRPVDRRRVSTATHGRTSRLHCS